MSISESIFESTLEDYFIIGIQNLQFEFKNVKTHSLKLQKKKEGIHLLSGSFCKHLEIILRNSLLYFLTSSLLLNAISREGGSF